MSRNHRPVRNGVSARRSGKIEAALSFFLTRTYDDWSSKDCRLRKRGNLARVCGQAAAQLIVKSTPGLAKSHRRELGLQNLTTATILCLSGRPSGKHIPKRFSSCGYPKMSSQLRAFEIIDFDAVAGVPCPCGTAKRALMEVDSVPYSLHITEISVDARVHYHQRLTETYLFLECGPDAYMELNGEKVPVKPQMAITIHPGTRHRAVGAMRVAIVASPKFDPSDEWFD